MPLAHSGTSRAIPALNLSFASKKCMRGSTGLCSRPFTASTGKSLLARNTSPSSKSGIFQKRELSIWPFGNKKNTDVPVTPSSELTGIQIPEKPEVLTPPIQDILIDKISSSSENLTSNVFPIDELNPPAVFANLIYEIHALTGLSWLGAILIGVLFVRLIILPLEVYGNVGRIKVSTHAKAISDLMEQQKYKFISGDIEGARNATSKLSRFKEENNIPGNIALFSASATRIFFAIVSFMGIRKLGEINPLGYNIEGYPWAPDLSLADPTGMVPIISIISMYITGMATAKVLVVNSTTEQRVVAVLMRVMQIPFFFVIYFMSTGACTFLITNNVVSTLAVLFMSKNSVRKMLSIQDCQPKHTGFMVKTRKLSVIDSLIQLSRASRR